MAINDNGGLLRDKVVPFRSPAADEAIPDMQGWTVEALNRAIDKGLASGPAVDFDFDAYIAAIRDDDDSNLA